MVKAVHTILITLFLVAVMLLPPVPPGPARDSGVASAARSRHFGVNVNMDPTEIAKMMFIHPQEIKTANLTIENTGNENDIFSLNVSIDYHGHEGLGWEAWLEESRIDIPLGEKEVVQVYIMGPDNGDMNDNINVTIKAISEGDNGIQDTGFFKTFLIINRGVRLTCRDNVHIAGATERTSFDCIVDNWGDMTEDIEIVIIDKPEEWKAELSTGLFEKVPPRGFRNLTLFVTPPWDALMDETGSVTIEARIVTLLNIKHSATTYTIVTCGPWVVLKTDDPEVSIDPGNSTTIPIVLESDGLGIQGPVTLEMNSRLPNGWEASLDRTTISLFPNPYQELNLLVRAPANAHTDDLVTIRITAYGMTHDIWYDDVTIRVKVNHFVRLNISVTPESITAAPGERITYNVLLTNEGDRDESFMLYYISFNDGLVMQFNDGLVSVRNISLRAGQSALFQVEVQVLDRALAGNWANWIVLKDALGKNQTIPIKTVVRQYHSVSIGLSNNAELVAPGDTVHFELRMTNYGNCQDNFSLLISGLPESWRYRTIYIGNTTNTVQLGPWKTADIEIYIDVPENWTYTQVSFVIDVVGPGGISKELNPVIKVEGCELSLERISYYFPSILLGKEELIEVTVRNSGRGACADVPVNFYDDGALQYTATIERLPTNVTKTVVFGWTPITAGGHRLMFVVDPKNKILEANEDDNTRVDKITVISHETYSGDPCLQFICVGVPALIVGVVIILWVLRKDFKGSSHNRGKNG